MSDVSIGHIVFLVMVFGLPMLTVIVVEWKDRNRFGRQSREMLAQFRKDRAH